jgi:hypothetical protein
MDRNSKFLSIMTEFQKWYYCFDEVKLNFYPLWWNSNVWIDGFTSQISEKWQPPWLAGNLKLIRYKRTLTQALVKFSLKKLYFHFFISSNLCILPRIFVLNFKKDQSVRNKVTAQKPMHLQIDNEDDRQHNRRNSKTDIIVLMQFSWTGKSE